MKKIFIIILTNLILFLSAYLVIAASPVFQSASVTSSPDGYDETSTLLGWCNAADADTANISYDATWYKNNEVYEEVLLPHIASGGTHTCGILTNNSAYCWGNGYAGALGYGGETSQVNPVSINISSTFKSITVGGEHTCGILTNDTAYCWGRNENGELGYGGNSLNNPNPIAVNISSTFKSISMNNFHTCGILTNGSAYCWGFGNSGRLGYGGTANQYNPIAVNLSSTLKSISVGGGHTCGILTNGTAYCWGIGETGRLGYGGTANQYNPIAVNISSTFKSISVGESNTCGILTNGTAYCWGYGLNGELGVGEWIDSPNPIAVNIASTFKSIYAGYLHTCGILTNGSAYCWGTNGNGELGDGSTTNRENPTPINIGSTFRSIIVGQYVTCGILTNGSGYCWGLNDYGQLGDGLTINRANPTPINITTTFIPLFTQSILSNIDTITYGLTAGDDWHIECSAYDGTTSATNFDSNPVTITSGGGGDAVPEFSDYGLLFVIIIGITGFSIIRRKE